MAQMGRPRTFDRDEAVQQAMFLFWEHGYESTSVSLLKANIGGGITAPSFYAAFGSKEQLFREVVERYIATYGQVNAGLWDESLSPREALEGSLRKSAKMQIERGHPKGCLLVLSVSTCTPENEHLQKFLAEQRARTRDGFHHCVQRAVDAGDLPKDTNVKALAENYHCFLLGLSIQARDGVSGAVLDAAITEAMRSWDAKASAVKN
ncbi:TetR/AcrR family transcriptional regulator [Alcaligenes faecalis]|uniref:TetR/AcrR family transcriptional regulator n=1 Tax=Alcaligenes faecalis TaxID=511 RepID=UPI001C9A70AB|nr:TetR/AcrR family transcriptional regulator [Alcaligenes faecalis]MBW4789303.1 TetR/AcrR family transcriptional regulator [Alcaligenes faecalis subsp. faecalis]MBY6311104.1 TetR/AcrR family transcriptional regulator [Alcaligenes faecalis]MBY6315776.1 TetR/AcrR family transcriptional regulator [Alcaligenes faecalis]MBY6391017.1 TetR/AcrR family transcriptional regulator [Alcaligenes faecalis]WHQ44377.1 TetR/AcrR family transcriptional regulator [Alcaligenes faecalis]